MTHVYVAAAGTGALLAGSVVAGALALAKKREYEAANRVYRDDTASLDRQTRSLNLITDVLLGASVMAAAGTAYLYFSREDGSNGAPKQSAGTVDVRGGVGLRSGWLGVHGRF